MTRSRSFSGGLNADKPGRRPQPLRVFSPTRQTSSQPPSLPYRDLTSLRCLTPITGRVQRGHVAEKKMGILPLNTRCPVLVPGARPPTRVWGGDVGP